MFQKATKTQSRLRLAIAGPSGSGKTYSALSVAQHLGSRIALIDTEHGSASKYAGLFDFDTAPLTNHHPGQYIELIKEAGRGDYDVIVIDSLSHAWFWELDQTSRAENSFRAWGDVRPLERALIDAMLSSNAHIIATMRTKTEWVIEEIKNRKGKSVSAPRKVGTAPIQASGIEYEFDLAGEMDLNHMLTISKSRCPDLANTTHLNPGEELADTLLNWLNDGSPLPESAESKCQRIKAAREAAGVDTDSVKQLMQTEFGGRTSPRQLSSDECDSLVVMIKGLEER
ncbi:MAG: ATP-binding protein [Cyanobacteria bacterium P01_G01_bin.38]